MAQKDIMTTIFTRNEISNMSPDERAIRRVQVQIWKLLKERGEDVSFPRTLRFTGIDDSPSAVRESLTSSKSVESISSTSLHKVSTKRNLLTAEDSPKYNKVLELVLSESEIFVTHSLKELYQRLLECTYVSQAANVLDMFETELFEEYKETELEDVNFDVLYVNEEVTAGTWDDPFAPHKVVSGMGLLDIDDKDFTRVPFTYKVSRKTSKDSDSTVSDIVFSSSSEASSSNTQVEPSSSNIQEEPSSYNLQEYCTSSNFHEVPIGLDNVESDLAFVDINKDEALHGSENLSQPTVTAQKDLEDADIIKNDDDIVLVGDSAQVPKVQQLVKKFVNEKEPSTPDEAVTFEAAVQAGVRPGEKNTDAMVLLDVNPLTVGIETVGGAMTNMIPHNTAIPTKKSLIFTTVRDNQRTVSVQVYEGERPMTKDNHLLGKFDLTGIPPAPRGVPQIKVTFEIDANGILQVSAEDNGTGNREKMVITIDQNRLTPDDIKRTIKDAEKFADDDKQLMQRVEARNELESYVYSLKYWLFDYETADVEKKLKGDIEACNELVPYAYISQLSETEKLGSKISDSEKTKLEEAVKEKIKWLNDNEEAGTENLKAQKEELEAVITKIYQESGGVPPSPTCEDVDLTDWGVRKGSCDEYD